MLSRKQTSSIFLTYIPYSRRGTGTSQSSYCLKVRKLKLLAWGLRTMNTNTNSGDLIMLELLRPGIGYNICLGLRCLQESTQFRSLMISRLAGVRPINRRYLIVTSNTSNNSCGPSPYSIHFSPFKTPFLSIYMSMCCSSNENKDNIVVSWHPLSLRGK